MFSSRLPRLTPNALGEAVAHAKRTSRVLLDLTETNPTKVGLSYPSDMTSSLADPAGARYEPDPRGMRAARQVVAAEYARATVRVDPDHIVLAPSTSDAYGWLFKLLCDPGDAVLVPQPSYPLFELLTGLEGVEAQGYRLEYSGAWWIDRDSLEHAIGPRTRAVLVVAPNNPTGSFVRAEDRDWLVALAAARRIAIIADEVFADYPLARRDDGRRMAGERDALVFALGGLSKSAGLPQLKLAWIAASGPDDLVAAALDRLDVIADTYLSVSTAVQVALPSLVAAGRRVRASIAERIARNLAHVRSALAAHPAVTMLEPEGGWSVVLRVPAIESEDDLVLRILRDDDVVVHPGYFFDFAEEAYLVLSLLPDQPVFDEALDRVLRAIDKGPA
jgi:aspartate/methionine/tyrosine aminotransferase